MLQESGNDAKFMRVAANAQKSLLVSTRNKLAQQLVDVQIHVSTISRCLPEYPFRLSCGIAAGFEEYCSFLLDSVRKGVQSRHRRVEGSVTDVLPPFEQNFQTLESQLDETFPST